MQIRLQDISDLGQTFTTYDKILSRLRTHGSCLFFFVVVTRLYNTVLCNITDMSAKVTVFFFYCCEFCRETITCCSNQRTENKPCTDSLLTETCCRTL